MQIFKNITSQSVAKLATLIISIITAHTYSSDLSNTEMILNPAITQYHRIFDKEVTETQESIELYTGLPNKHITLQSLEINLLQQEAEAKSTLNNLFQVDDTQEKSLTIYQVPSVQSFSFITQYPQTEQPIFVTAGMSKKNKAQVILWDISTRVPKVFKELIFETNENPISLNFSTATNNPNQCDTIDITVKNINNLDGYTILSKHYTSARQQLNNLLNEIKTMQQAMLVKTILDQLKSEDSVAVTKEDIIKIEHLTFYQETLKRYIK